MNYLVEILGLFFDLPSRVHILGYGRVLSRVVQTAISAVYVNL